MLVTVVKVALWWGMKGREQEVERKVGNSSVFKRKKIHGNQHTSSNLSHNLIQNQPKLLWQELADLINPEYHKY